MYQYYYKPLFLKNSSLLFLLPALLLCGCSSSESEDELHAHVIPAHRPQHFPDAVITIEKEIARFDSWTDTQHEEFRDIIVWLPELAAETDLKKTEWEKVNLISTQLLQKFETSTDQSLKEFIESHLEELKALAVTAIKNNSFNEYQDFEFPSETNSKESNNV